MALVLVKKKLRLLPKPKRFTAEQDVQHQIDIEVLRQTMMNSTDPEERDRWLNNLQTYAKTGNLAPLVNNIKYIRDIVPMEEFMYGKAYLGLDRAEIFPSVHRACIDLDTDKYVEAILKGALGTGKTTLANIMLARSIYKMSCMDCPQEAFGVQRGSSLVFTIQSVRFNTAKKAVFEDFGRYIKNSPYFRDMFPYDYKIQSQMVFKKHNITVLPVSSSNTGAISMNVVGGILDEMNFMQKIEHSKSSESEFDGTFDQAKRLYNTLSRRRRSRFTKHGKLPGILFVISSSRFPDDFTEEKAKEAFTEGGTDPTIYVYSHSQWSAKSRSQFLPDEFRVLVGTQHVRSRILKADEENPEGCTVINVPMDFFTEFEKDIEGSIRDFAGITTLATRPFILKRNSIYDAMESAFNAGYNNIFNMEEVDLSMGLPRPVKDRIRLDVERDRVCHIDLGLKKDACGLAIGHVAGLKRQNVLGIDGETYKLDSLPIVAIDAMLRIVPPPNDEIDFSSIRRLLFMLVDDYKIPIRWITMDGFQCIVGDSQIWTDRGMVLAKDIKIGDIVQSRIGARPVTKVWSFGKQPCLTITTNEGHRITVTDNHKLEACVDWVYPTIRGSQQAKEVWGWKKAADLRVGDILHTWDGATEVKGQNPIRLKYVGGERHTHFHCPSELDSNFALLLGLLWGDGYIHNDFVKLTVAPTDLDDAVAAFKNILDCDIKVSRKDGINAYDVIFHSRSFCKCLQINGLIKSYDFIPEKILASNRYVQAAFIQGLFSTDGSVKKRDGQPSYSTKSKVWAQYVQNFLRMAFGISSIITTSERTGNNYRTDSTHQYIVSVRGSRAAFDNAIGFYYQSKQEELDKHLHIKGRNIKSRIVSIEQTEGEVYDFEVAEDHSYLANGFVSHNSVDSRQILRKRGFKCDYLSVEKIEPYRSLRDTLYDGRLLLPRNNFVQRELAELEQIIHNNKERVDHRPNGTKDVSDAVCGVTAFLLKRREVWGMRDIPDDKESILFGETSVIERLTEKPVDTTKSVGYEKQQGGIVRRNFKRRAIERR